MRKATAAISAVVILLLAVPAAAAGGDIAGFFAMYYEQQIAGAVYKGPLDFLRDAAARHAGSDKVLQPMRRMP